jgi:hypothetical protein
LRKIQHFFVSTNGYNNFRFANSTTFLLNQLIDSYYSSVFNSVVRLSGLSDEKELKTLTGEILDDLLQRKEQLAAESRKGVFVYKVILAHLFAHLEAKGNTQRIEFLRKILLIHPSNYLQLPDSSGPGEAPK